MSKTEFWFTLYECEHDGDLQNYLSDIQESGGKVLSSEINHQAEIAQVHVNIENINDFYKKIKETDTFGFLQSGIE